MKKIIIMFLAVLFVSSCNNTDMNNENKKASNNEIRKEKQIKKIENKPITIESLKEEIKTCDTEICKKIAVEKYGVTKRSVESCELLDDERSQQKCKNKIVWRLALKERDIKYCSMLEEMDKQMCEEEYNRIIEEEKRMLEEMK